MTHLAQLQKDYIPVENDRYHLEADDKMDTVKMYFTNPKRQLVGVFNLKEQTGKTTVDLEDGTYLNLISKETVAVENGKMALENTPALFEIKTR